MEKFSSGGFIQGMNLESIKESRADGDVNGDQSGVSQSIKGKQRKMVDQGGKFSVIKIIKRVLFLQRSSSFLRFGSAKTFSDICD